jgi:hypothetical protein
MPPSARDRQLVVFLRTHSAELTDHVPLLVA